MKVLPFILGAVLAPAGLFNSALAGGPSDSDAEREARWQEVSAYIFGDCRVEPTDSLIRIEAPARALDAALVPITLVMPEKDKIKGVYLVIDDNPSPYAAHIAFGPAAEPSQVKLRVRIDSYTNVHAIAETKDGQLFRAVAFVKASGGCSAPMGVSDEEAMQGMGDMKMKFSSPAPPDGAIGATLMIRHPNFNGMQMNQITRNYTPARYIKQVTVAVGDRDVLTIDGDISISTDPVFGFSFVPRGDGSLKVVVVDSAGARWEQSFAAPALSN